MFPTPLWITSLVVVATCAFWSAPRPRVQEPEPEVHVRNVAIVVYPEVELLDFAGPGEVFAATHTKDGPAFNVYLVAETRAPLWSLGFVQLTPQYTLADCPKPDIVVVPGGSVPESQKLRDWVKAQSKQAELMMSVCNGALVYGGAGLLGGLEVTTHHSALQSLAMIEPTAKVYSNRRFVDSGKVMTAAGISAGIDGALHVVERMCGEDVAWQTAKYMEYDWRPDELAKLHAQPGKAVDGAESLRWIASIRKVGIQGAVAEYKSLEKAPDEKQMNAWGYTLVRAGNVAEASDLFHLVVVAFPTSANAADSWSEALELLSDKAGAQKAAQECLARMPKDASLDADARKILHNAAASRAARCSGAAPASFPYVCPPCGRHCDEVGYLEATRCPNCPMQLVERGN